MDPRADPRDFWDFGPYKPGILSNAGGRATEDVMRSIRTLSGIMADGDNTVGAVAVVHHTDCGLWNCSNARVAETLKEHSGLSGDRAAEVDKMDFGSWSE